MSDHKHTPGPWWTSNLEVGTVPMMHVKVARVSGSNLDEAMANARLIAAAPDLFAVVELMVEQITHPGNADHTLGAFSLGARIAEARAAIAKVRVRGAK